MSATLRVVLAPHAAVDARRLLDEAAALARALDAELAALFVEESDLLRCLALPFSREVGLVSGAIRAADPEATRRQLARSADQLRDLVAQTAVALGLPWSFAVARGDLVREALAAASAAPVLLAPPRSPAQHAVGSPAAHGGATVAVLDEPPSDPDEPAGPDAARVRDVAVLFADGRADAVARLRLDDLVHGSAPRVLVVSLASVASRPGLLERVLAAARCPVVLVGPDA